MDIIIRGIKSLFNFMVGDIRLLIGTLASLAIAALAARALPGLSGLLLFVLLAITLAVALRREVK